MGDNVLDLIHGKVDKIDGKGLSDNNYTTTEKNKLANIEANANYYELPETLPADMIVTTRGQLEQIISDILNHFDYTTCRQKLC